MLCLKSRAVCVTTVRERVCVSVYVCMCVFVYETALVCARVCAKDRERER